MRLTFARCTAGFRHHPALRRAARPHATGLRLCHAPAARRRCEPSPRPRPIHTRRHSRSAALPVHHLASSLRARSIPSRPPSSPSRSSQARQQGSPALRELICTARKLWDRAEGSAPALVASYRLVSTTRQHLIASPPRRLSPLAPHIASRHDPCCRDRRAYPEPHRHRRAARDIVADCRDLVQRRSQTAPSSMPGCGM